ncbi:IS66 family insertion sequence element accessory protein TnpA [Psychromonas antarctica]|uniref:IS66 family insertion sequence element accessory protein TnpA n=1 Tax=Psychromonas antarctica TaxID=67573 RepID=UPI001EE8188A|nr:hypothetical protein [Psychromonas antarctica]MCG6201218.1 hypothetical protein [Psychromonas antarctica]
MHIKPLTKIQQGWLDHINQASEQNLSMSAYAKQHNLALKSFYNARSALIKKGVLPAIINNTLMPITIPPLGAEQLSSSCRVTLCNGVIVELADIDLVSLFKSVSQL